MVLRDTTRGDEVDLGPMPESDGDRLLAERGADFDAGGRYRVYLRALEDGERVVLRELSTERSGRGLATLTIEAPDALGRSLSAPP